MQSETSGRNDLISCSFHWLGQFRPVDSRCSNFSRTWLPTIPIWYGCTLYFWFWICSHNLFGIQCADFPLDFVAKWLWVFFGKIAIANLLNQLAMCEVLQKKKKIANKRSHNDDKHKNELFFSSSNSMNLNVQNFTKLLQNISWPEQFFIFIFFRSFGWWYTYMYSVYLNSFKHIVEIEKLKEFKINRKRERKEMKKGKGKRTMNCCHELKTLPAILQKYAHEHTIMYSWKFNYNKIICNNKGDSNAKCRSSNANRQIVRW